MAIRERLVGTWSLETYTEIPIDGSPSVHPFGEAPEGFIMYTPDGFMSVQLSKPGRRPFSSADWFHGTDAEYRSQGSGYIAYCGPFRVDESREEVIHVIAVSLFPNWAGQAQPRTVKFEGDYLILGNTSRYNSGGKVVNAEIRWKKVQPLDAKEK